MSVEVLDLFSAAAGGWSLGLHRAGYTTIAACEVEAWRRALYAENNPHVRLYDDVRTLTADRLRADLGRLPTFVVGSPPCQDISSANTKGRGVEGERSGLYFEAVRIIGECRPRWFALENSANLRTRGADAVIAALEAIGYTCWATVVRAGDIDANHERPRAWLIGCDLEQVADADGIGRDEGRRWGRGGVDLSIPADTGDAAQDRCGPGLSGRRAVATERLPVEACRDAADTNGDALRLAIVPRGPQPEAALAGDADPATDTGQAERRSGELAGSSSERTTGGRQQGPGEPRSVHSAGGETRDAAHTDQARQAHGCMEPSLRQAEIADDGRGSGRCDDGPITGQMGLCAPDCGHAVRGGADWSLADLAGHLRLDDGLSARLAGTRVAVGDGKGQSAASLVVEAFGDAVIPQIPEAIGRAIQRVERAMAAIHDRIAA